MVCRARCSAGDRDTCTYLGQVIEAVLICAPRTNSDKAAWTLSFLEMRGTESESSALYGTERHYKRLIVSAVST